MKVKNTSFFKTAKIKEVIRFVKPPGITKFDIWIKTGHKRDWRGRAYFSGCSYHETFCPYVSLAISPKNKYPIIHVPEQKRGYLPFKAFTDIELLVNLVAHELRHLWQKKHPKGWRVWGSRGQFSERDADAYAIHKVRQWRRRENV